MNILVILVIIGLAVLFVNLYAWIIKQSTKNNDEDKDKK